MLQLRTRRYGRLVCALIVIMMMMMMWILFFRGNLVVRDGAFVTFLSDDAYLIGARVLRQSILESGSRFPLVVLVTDQVSEETKSLLRVDGCLIKEVEVVPNPKSDEIRYKWVYSKLRAWEMIEYDRIVFLDADVILLENIDELFSGSFSRFAVSPDCW